MGFQQEVNRDPSPAVEGDFASNNPRQVLTNAGQGQMVAGADGAILGRFAWVDANGLVGNTYPGAGARLGFLARPGQVALIVEWLGGYSLQVQSGMPVTVHAKLDTFARFAAGATPQQKVFASFTDGTAIAGAAAPVANITGSVTTGSPDITALSAAVAAGSPVSGTGIPAGTTIITGAAAGGTAVMSANATATGAAEAIAVTTAQATPFIVVAEADANGLAKISPEG